MGGKSSKAAKAKKEGAAPATGRASQTGKPAQRASQANAQAGRSDDAVQKDLKDSEKLAAIQAKIAERKSNEGKAKRAAALRKTQVERENKLGDDLEDRLEKMKNITVKQCN